MHCSKTLSTVLFTSFLTITALTIVPQLTGENRAVAQNNTQTIKKPSDKKCTDKDTLALYKAVNELNIRVNVGLNYADFTKYYTDLVIGLSNLPLTEDCKQVREQINVVRSKYNLARMLWKRSFRQQFMSVDDVISVEVLAYKPDLRRYNNSLSVDDIVMVYLTMAVEEFEKIKL